MTSNQQSAISTSSRRKLKKKFGDIFICLSFVLLIFLFLSTTSLASPSIRQQAINKSYYNNKQID